MPSFIYYHLFPFTLITIFAKVKTSEFEYGLTCTEVESMAPHHWKRTQPTDNFLLQIKFSKGCYENNDEMIKVQLIFNGKGYAIQARKMKEYKLRSGLFLPNYGKNQKHHCDELAAMTHKKLYKFQLLNSETFAWKPSKLYKDSILFRAVILRHSMQYHDINKTLPHCNRTQKRTTLTVQRATSYDTVNISLTTTTAGSTKTGKSSYDTRNVSSAASIVGSIKTTKIPAESTTSTTAYDTKNVLSATSTVGSIKTAKIPAESATNTTAYDTRNVSSALNIVRSTKTGKSSVESSTSAEHDTRNVSSATSTVVSKKTGKSSAESTKSTTYDTTNVFTATSNIGSTKTGKSAVESAATYHTINTSISLATNTVGSTKMAKSSVLNNETIFDTESTTAATTQFSTTPTYNCTSTIFPLKNQNWTDIQSDPPSWNGKIESTLYQNVFMHRHGKIANVINYETMIYTHYYELDSTFLGCKSKFTPFLLLSSESSKANLKNASNIFVSQGSELVLNNCTQLKNNSVLKLTNVSKATFGVLNISMYGSVKIGSNSVLNSSEFYVSNNSSFSMIESLADIEYLNIVSEQTINTVLIYNSTIIANSVTLWTKNMTTKSVQHYNSLYIQNSSIAKISSIDLSGFCEVSISDGSEITVEEFACESGQFSLYETKVCLDQNYKQQTKLKLLGGGSIQLTSSNMNIAGNNIFIIANKTSVLMDQTDLHLIDSEFNIYYKRDRVLNFTLANLVLINSKFIVKNTKEYITNPVDFGIYNHLELINAEISIELIRPTLKNDYTLIKTGKNVKIIIENCKLEIHLARYANRLSIQDNVIFTIEDCLRCYLSRTSVELLSNNNYTLKNNAAYDSNGNSFGGFSCETASAATTTHDSINVVSLASNIVKSTKTGKSSVESAATSNTINVTAVKSTVGSTKPAKSSVERASTYDTKNISWDTSTIENVESVSSSDTSNVSSGAIKNVESASTYDTTNISLVNTTAGNGWFFGSSSSSSSYFDG